MTIEHRITPLRFAEFSTRLQSPKIFLISGSHA